MGLGTCLICGNEYHDEIDMGYIRGRGWVGVCPTCRRHVEIAGKLIERNKALQEENRKLQENLDKALCGSPWDTMTR
jgi:hypothetical protein